MLSEIKFAEGDEMEAALLQFPLNVSAFDKTVPLEAELIISLEENRLLWKLRCWPNEYVAWTSKWQPVDPRVLTFVYSSTAKRFEFPTGGLNRLFGDGNFFVRTESGWPVLVDEVVFRELADTYIEWLAKVIAENFKISATAKLRHQQLSTDLSLVTPASTSFQLHFHTKLSEDEFASFERATV